MKINCPICNYPIEVFNKEKVITCCPKCNSVLEKRGYYFFKLSDQISNFDFRKPLEIWWDIIFKGKKYKILWVSRFELDDDIFDRYYIEDENSDDFYIDDKNWDRILLRLISTKNFAQDFEVFKAWNQIKIATEKMFILESYYSIFNSVSWIYSPIAGTNSENYCFILNSYPYKYILEYNPETRFSNLFEIL